MWYPPYVTPPSRPPGETYALVLAWFAIGLGTLATLLGLALVVFLVLGVTLVPALGLDVVNTLVGYGVPFLLGGILAIYFGITRVTRRPSLRFELPSVAVLLLLVLVALGGGVLIWHHERFPGPVALYAPLALLAGWLPALAILAFATSRLWNPSTRRHVWLSLFYGSTLAIVLAQILEFVLIVVLIVVMGVLGYSVNPNVGSATFQPQSSTDTFAMLAILSVIAPVVEEGLKPLGAVLIMRRLRTPGEAFLVGLAGGIGFDMVETIGYIGMGQADWVTIAIDRIGAGLLHGVGAGMSALGWYYLINGKGVPARWWRAVGCFLYALLQHGIFNGANLLPSLPQPLEQPIYLGSLPIDGGTVLFFGFYLIILGVLVFMTGRLRRADTTSVALPATGGTQ